MRFHCRRSDAKASHHCLRLLRVGCGYKVILPAPRSAERRAESRPERQRQLPGGAAQPLGQLNQHNIVKVNGEDQSPAVSPTSGHGGQPAGQSLHPQPRPEMLQRASLPPGERLFYPEIRQRRVSAGGLQTATDITAEIAPVCDQKITAKAAWAMKSYSYEFSLWRTPTPSPNFRWLCAHTSLCRPRRRLGGVMSPVWTTAAHQLQRQLRRLAGSGCDFLSPAQTLRDKDRPLHRIYVMK